MAPERVAALFVVADGPYGGRSDVDPWPVERDARLYPGPYSVVAHPPCERWGRYATGGPNPKARRRLLGDDGGCFTAALQAVRDFGGVLEHPAGSHAFAKYSLPLPPHRGWSDPDSHGGRSSRVDQGAYGHPAKKATWLYACLTAYPELDWEPVASLKRHDPGYRSKEQAKTIRSSPGYVPIPRLTRAERLYTPAPFLAVLLTMAAHGKQAAGGA